MEYKCKTVNISRLIVGLDGVVSPLCDTCQAGDCTNPIRSHKVSIFGVNQTVKLFDRGSERLIVVDCEGYTQ